MRLAALAAALLLLSLTGCSGLVARPTSSAATPSPATAPDAPVSGPTGAGELTAQTMLAQLMDAKLGLSNGAVQDERTDPDHLLGRPDGYRSRASFDLPGGNAAAAAGTLDRGGVIEVFADRAAGQRRSAAIERTLKGSPIGGTEYDYRNGGVLVRIAGTVAPSVAQPIGVVVAGLDGS